MTGRSRRSTTFTATTSRMNAALSGKGDVPDTWADEVMADNQNSGAAAEKRRNRPGRDNHFTRALFGFERPARMHALRCSFRTQNQTRHSRPKCRQSTNFTRATRPVVDGRDKPGRDENGCVIPAQFPPLELRLSCTHLVLLRGAFARRCDGGTGCGACGSRRNRLPGGIGAPPAPTRRSCQGAG